MAENGAAGYADARASLRDTAKWFATVVAGLGAALTAGLSLTDLGGFSDHALRQAALAGGIAALMIVIGVALMIGILMVRAYYLTDVINLKGLMWGEHWVKKEILAHKVHVLPANYQDLLSLQTAYTNAQNDVRTVNSAENRERLKSFEAAVFKVTDFAAFLSLSRTVRIRMWLLCVVALVGSAAVARFSYVVSREAAALAHPATTVAVLQPGQDWAPLAKALSAACGDGPFAVTMLPVEGLPGQWSATVTAPRCAGATWTVPDTFVTIRP